MKATMKHAAAASKHGIMITPNQPTYNLLFVDVTHSQNSGQPARRLVCLREIFEVVISKTILSRAPRVDAKLISCNPSLQDMRDYCLYCSQVSVKSSLHWRAILSSPLLGVENNTLSLFILTQLYILVKNQILPSSSSSLLPRRVWLVLLCLLLSLRTLVRYVVYSSYFL